MDEILDTTDSPSKIDEIPSNQSPSNNPTTTEDDISQDIDDQIQENYEEAEQSQESAKDMETEEERSLEASNKGDDDQSQASIRDNEEQSQENDIQVADDGHYGDEDAEVQKVDVNEQNEAEDNVDDTTEVLESSTCKDEDSQQEDNESQENVDKISISTGDGEKSQDNDEDNLEKIQTDENNKSTEKFSENICNLEEVDANVSINKSHDDNAEDVLYDDRTQSGAMDVENDVSECGDKTKSFLNEVEENTPMEVDESQTTNDEDNDKNVDNDNGAAYKTIADSVDQSNADDANEITASRSCVNIEDDADKIIADNTDKNAADDANKNTVDNEDINTVDDNDVHTSIVDTGDKSIDDDDNDANKGKSIDETEDFQDVEMRSADDVDQSAKVSASEKDQSNNVTDSTTITAPSRKDVNDTVDGSSSKDVETVVERIQNEDDIQEIRNQSEQTENETEVNESTTENVQEEAQGESADVCLIPDNDEELTGAEKEQAILARQNAEKEDDEKEKAAATTSESEEVTGIIAGQDKADAPETIEIFDDSNSAEKVVPKKSNETPKTSESVATTTKTSISLVVGTNQTCSQCHEIENCEYRLKDNETGEYIYLCNQNCIDKLIVENLNNFVVRKRKFMVDDLSEPKPETCIVCKTNKECKYFFKQDEDTLYICSRECFNDLDAKEPDKLRMKRMSIRVKNLGGVTMSAAHEAASIPEPKIVARTPQEAELARLDREASFIRRCAGCALELQVDISNLKWQSLDFCNQLCLSKYQQIIGSKCRNCFGVVSHPSLGKYCVRFGFDICQFCCAGCLDKYKKRLKNCSYCQKDISKNNEGFLAPVGDNEQFKDFCSQNCMKRYDSVINPTKKIRIDQCAVCNNKKTVVVELAIDGREICFCSNPCFSAFKFVNNVTPDKCDLCTKWFDRKSSDHFTIYTENGQPKIFCTKICLNFYITKSRKIVFCQWCKVKKYNFDMIERRAPDSIPDVIIMCSLNCLVLYEVSLTRITKQKMKCDHCLAEKTPQYHLTMSDSSMRNFCTYQCVMQFQSQFATQPLTLNEQIPNQPHQQEFQQNPFPTGLPKRIKSNQSAVRQQLPTATTKQTQKQQQQKSAMPVISQIQSLAPVIEPPPPPPPQRKGSRRAAAQQARQQVQLQQQQQQQHHHHLQQQQQTQSQIYHSLHDFQPQIEAPPQSLTSDVGTMTTDSNVKTAIITIPPVPPKISNKRIMCRPITHTKGVTCKPLSFNAGCQTAEDMTAKILIPVPVPIYVPQPMSMYSLPYPVPVPIPLPIPVPIFIPTKRNSANGIMKEIKKIQDKMPSDPFEAELLMMAEMVAGDDKKNESDSDDEEEPPAPIENDNYNDDEIVSNTNNPYGEDVLQMALKMATEYDEPAVDLESAMTASTITQPPPDSENEVIEQEEEDQPMMYSHLGMQTGLLNNRGRGRKRGSYSPRGGATPAKRGRRNDSVIHQSTEPIIPETQPVIPIEKPDANMCLKYTFGVNAWKQWVMTKNAELEKSPVRRKPFKSELLQMTADELSYSLCLFVKEVRKPNGTEYAPDTIYYLVLGIQQYLYENGRIDNIFTDPYYERFTDCLDEVARKFSVLYNDSQYIVTRVEEEHLWECKQLGAHSPHVLLSTLMFFNTKYFNLTTVDEHMQLSFSHIMKHWKRNPQGIKQPGTRNVLLRFYPPQNMQDTRKKKVYEQQENETNPLRCPVRLYEFYLSKCPESVKTRNDVFYLQPERSCVPDSPVWYSTQAMTQESLQKMLHRVKMVKEINVAILNL